MSDSAADRYRAVNDLGPHPLRGDQLEAVIAAKVAARAGLEALRALPLSFVTPTEPAHATYKLAEFVAP